MDRLDAMSILVKILDAGSLSLAAKQLGIPLATVSRRIADLEKHLGVRVLNRTSRHLSLTSAGKTYIGACREILQDVEDAERTLAGFQKTPKGQLTITAPVVFGRTHIVPIICTYLLAYPEVNVKLLLADRILNIADADIDIAVRIGQQPGPILNVLPVGSVRRVTCASPHYLRARGIPEVPEDLSQHSCVTFDNLASSTAWHFKSSTDDLTVPIQSRLIVTTAEAAIDGAVAGLGVTRLLSYQVADHIRAERLALLLEEFEPEPWPVCLVLREGQSPPAKLRAFVDHAIPLLKDRITNETALFSKQKRGRQTG